MEQDHGTMQQNGWAVQAMCCALSIEILTESVTLIDWDIPTQQPSRQGFKFELSVALKASLRRFLLRRGYEVRVIDVKE